MHGSNKSTSSTPTFPEPQGIPESSQKSMCLEVSFQVIPYLAGLGITKYIITCNRVSRGDIGVIFMNCQIFGFNLGTTGS